jgi:hypothetical protein
MKKQLLLSLCLAASALLTGCGKVHTGEVGVRTDFNGVVNERIEGEGFYTAITSHMDRYSTQEVAINLDNLRPKAKDNLSLQELDMTVYYRVNPASIRPLSVKRVGQSYVLGTGAFAPQAAFVESVARSEVADVVSRHDSLTIHKDRAGLEADSLKQIQASLDKSDPGAFVITRVVARQVLTDPTVEASIRNVVAKQKEKEAADLQVGIAESIASATAKTAQTLTPQFLQHEYNQVLMEFAKKGGTVILDGSGSNKQFVLRQ